MRIIDTSEEAIELMPEEDAEIDYNELVENEDIEPFFAAFDRVYKAS